MDEPKIVRRDDGSFEVLNLDVDALNPGQRVGYAAVFWPDVKASMEAHGEFKEADKSTQRTTPGIGTYDDIDVKVAAAVKTAKSGVRVTRKGLLEKKNVREAAIRGEYATVADVERAVGRVVRGKLSEGRPSGEDKGSGIFGKGDKFDKVAVPMSRYLKGWESRNFEFTHINPREAKRRLAIVEELMQNLERVRDDLAKRSHVARLSLPSVSVRKEKK